MGPYPNFGDSNQSNPLQIDGPLVLASHNPNKIAAFREALADIPADVLSARELGLSSPAETGTTVRENALIKARSVARQSGHAAISDDSGFCVTELDDLPGAAAIDWAGPRGDYEIAIDRIGDMLKERGLSGGKARFVTCIVLALPDGTALASEGATTGNLIWPPRGPTEGYLSIFALHDDDKTIAEKMAGSDMAGTHQLEAYQHRGPAIQRLLDRVQFI